MTTEIARRIPTNVDRNPVIRLLTSARATLETLLIRNITLLQIEGRFVNGNSHVVPAFLIVTSPLDSEVVERVLQEIIDKSKDAKKPFDKMFVLHPKEFDRVVDAYTEGSSRTTRVQLYDHR